MKKIEKLYSKIFKRIIYMVNPIKSKVKSTECIVHKYINEKAIELLYNEGHLCEYEFFKKYIMDLNEGVKWADSDLKSVNHFYHHKNGKGLYGFSNAYAEASNYYNKAKALIIKTNVNKAIFYLGATCHLVQDSTVPAHAMKSLRNHRPLEKHIISKINKGYDIVKFEDWNNEDDIKKIINHNATFAINVKEKYKDVVNKDERFDKISEEILLRACISTKNLLLGFYENYILQNMKEQ